MGLINREGTYRGITVSGGGARTGKSKYPQVLVQLRAMEFYDEEEDKWIDWSEYEENEMIGYLLLAGSDKTKSIFHWESIEKVYGWDGESFNSLATIEYENVQVQFRVGYGEGDYSDKLGVKSIDLYDADPTNKLTLLDEAGLTELTAQYATLFRSKKGEKKPVKLAGTPVVPGKKTETATETQAATTPPKAKKATKKNKKTCSQSQAWLTCQEAKAKSVDNAKLTEIWLKTVEINAPDGDEDKVKPEMWAQIRDQVIEQVKDDIPF